MSLTGSTFQVLVVSLTLIAFGGLVVSWPTFSRRTVPAFVARVGGLALVNVLVVLTVMTQLNAHYLFYTGWSDLFGPAQPVGRPVSRGDAAAVAARIPLAATSADPARVPALPAGRLGTNRRITFEVHGRRSGLTGSVLVELPPGYTLPVNSGRRYPVLETFSGYPGAPSQWLRVMHLGRALNHAVSAGQVGPALIVSPEVEIPSGTDTECVNGPAGTPQLETWLADDVPSWVEHTFRVDPERSGWATIGLSAGAWCAAMLTMLHPQQFSAAVVMGGYFHPLFAGGRQPFPPGSPLAARYDLVRLAGHRPPPVAIWLQTSRSDPLSYGPSEALLRNTHAPLAVSATVLTHAGHRISVWQSVLPEAIGWLGDSIPGFAPASTG